MRVANCHSKHGPIQRAGIVVAVIGIIVA